MIRLGLIFPQSMVKLTRFQGSKIATCHTYLFLCLKAQWLKDIIPSKQIRFMTKIRLLKAYQAITIGAAK